MVIVGRREAAETRALLAVAGSLGALSDELVVVDEDSRSDWQELAPFAAQLPMREGRATAVAK